MSKEILQERVTRVFSDPKISAYADNYLKGIREQLHELDVRARTSTILLVLLVILFIFFSQALVSEVSLGPVKLKDISVIFKLVPALFAYQFFVYAVTENKSNTLMTLHRAIVNKIYPTLRISALDEYLLPKPSVLFYDPETRLEGTLSKLQSIMGAVTAIGVLYVLPFVFEIYAFYYLFAQFGSDPVVWISLVFAMFFMIQGYIVQSFPVNR